MSGWADAPLRPVGPRGGRRRDLPQLDPDFLSEQLHTAWPKYAARYHKQNSSLGQVLFDAEDVEQELWLLLVEEATRFDPDRGASFATYAVNRQRAALLDVSRRRMGRKVADASVAASNGRPISAKHARQIQDWHNLRVPQSLDAVLTDDGFRLHDVLADVPPMKPEERTPEEMSSRPPARDLVDHPDKQVARAAQKAVAAAKALDTVFAEFVGRAELRAKEADLAKALAEVRAQLRGKPTAKPTSPDVDTKAVRAWAEQQGREVKPTGMLPKAVVEAYRKQAAA